jgi:hypothetical protein
MKTRKLRDSRLLYRDWLMLEKIFDRGSVLNRAMVANIARGLEGVGDVGTCAKWGVGRHSIFDL